MRKSIFVSGQSMFEVVIALFIITMIIVGVVSLTTYSLSNAVFSKNKTLAGKFSQEAIEWLRFQREEDIAVFLANVTNSNRYCLQTLVWTNTGICGSSELISNTIFRREVVFTTSTASGKNLIEADVITYWTDSRGYHESKSVTNFTDIREKD